MVSRGREPRCLEWWVAVAFLLLIQHAEVGWTADPSQEYQERIQPFLQRYCTTCHGGAEPEVGLALDKMQPKRLLKDRAVWDDVIRYVKAGEMPPAGKPQPLPKEKEAFLLWLNTQLEQLDCNLQDPGRPTLRRLNRTEYFNTVRDLFGIRKDPTEGFPTDDTGYGFDNIGDVLSLSPLLLEKYLEAAAEVARQTIIDPATYRPDVLQLGVSELQHRGELLSNYSLNVDIPTPMPGTFAITIKAWGQRAGDELPKMAVRLDGREIQQVEVKGGKNNAQTFTYQQRLETSAQGLARLEIAFLNDFYDPEAKKPWMRDRNLFIEQVKVEGPLEISPRHYPASHKQILFDRPSKPQDTPTVAAKLLEPLARRIYRRPAQPEEIQQLAQLVQLAEQQGESFERGMQLALQAMLVSPSFLFRLEVDNQPDKPIAHPINDFELASRLSYFLWSSTPDEELLNLAAANKLHEPAIFDAQVQRLLQDPKANALVENFAGQWLETRKMALTFPNSEAFPQFDLELRQAMVQETELFFATILKEDRSILEFLDADWTMVNERLAKHYGIEGIKGAEFRKVPLPDKRRGGLLTQGTFLTITSYPSRTSPVKRGVWVLENLFHDPPPPPPPNVEELPDGKRGRRLGSVRQRLEMHRKNPECAACHSKIDPIGFGLENFDAIGAWRDQDGKSKVDASGELGGVKFDGVEQLRSVLMQRQQDFARCLTEKMLTYALGRGMEYYDRCAVDAIVQDLAKHNFRASRLIHGIVHSEPFRKRRGEGE